jgi:type I restriction enzyme M protein
VTESHAAEVVDRLWRAYAPFPRGRSTFGDLTSMLAILLLARFVESVGEPEDEFVKHWDRAVAEARIGISPLRDLNTAMWSVSRHPRFPALDLRSLDDGFLGRDGQSDDLPWVAAFLTALDRRPALGEARLPEVCELLLERHVEEGTFSTSEFYTPRAVVRLLVELASPQPGDRILDPACGTGGLLGAVAQRVAESGRVDGASFEAYAVDRSNPGLAMMNLAIHGVDRPLVRISDPASLIHSRGNGVVDRVVSNPPFNQRIRNDYDADWPFSPPPESNANFAWLQLALARLSETGTATMVMAQGAALSSGREAEIRREMVANGVLLGIIALPQNLFTRTSVPVYIWMLARDKHHHLPKDDANAVLFINASRLGKRAPRQRRVLTTDDIERITSRLHAWRRSPSSTLDEPGFSRSVTHEEILENDGNLDPRQYVDLVQKDRPKTALDTSSVLDELDQLAEETRRSGADLRRSFGMSERLIRGGIEPSREQLQSIVKGHTGGIIEDSMQGQFFAGPSGSLLRLEDYVTAGAIPVVMPKDLTSNGFSVASIRYVTECKAQELDRFRLRRGDVVLARRGELGRCAVVREEHEGWICGTGCFVLRPPTGLDPDYFAAYLRSPEVRNWLELRSTGSTTMKTISLDVLGGLPVVLPDLGTQQAIAGAMGQLDDHERLLRDHLALTQKIRRNTLSGLLASNGLVSTPDKS